MTRNSMIVCDAAKLANVQPEVVRYYSRIRLIKPRLIKPHRNKKNGYKLYGSDDISKLIFIRKSRALGYTLQEIRKILSHSDAGTSPCPMVRTIIENRIGDNWRRLYEMLELQQRMEIAIQRWQHMPDGIPDHE